VRVFRGFTVLSCLLLTMTLLGQSSADDERRLKPLDGRVWRGRYSDYMKRAAALARDASAAQHAKLGDWAWEQRLEDEAWEQWIQAITLNPDHETTRKAMGYVKRGDAWVRPGEVRADLVTKAEADGRAFSFTIAIEDEADKAFLEEFSWRLRRLNRFVWHLTEGQVFLKKLTIVDKSSSGRIVIGRGKLLLTLMQGGGAFCMNSGRPNWKVMSGGRCYVRVLCHELFHGIFGLPDERHGCFCIMQGGLYGIRTTELEVCDDKTHRRHPVTPKSCWSLIKARYPKMTRQKDFGRAPEVQIVTKFSKPTASKPARPETGPSKPARGAH